MNSLGYCDLAWAEAVSQQAHKLQHTSNLYYTAPCGKLAKKLCKRTGMSKVFFGNSGAEANEGAIKAARKYSADHYGKDRFTAMTGSRDFIDMGNGLRMSLARNKTSANRLDIIYDADRKSVV